MRRQTPESTAVPPADAENGERPEPRYEIFSEKFTRYLQAYQELVESPDAERNIDAYHKPRYAKLRPDDPHRAALMAQDRELTRVAALLIQKFFEAGKVTDELKTLLKNMAPLQSMTPLVITQEGLIKRTYAVETAPHANAQIVALVREDDPFAHLAPRQLLEEEVREFANAVRGLADYRASKRNIPFREEALTVDEIKNLALAPEWGQEEWG